MRDVIPDLLWLGDVGDLRDPGCLERIGITALVHLALEERVPQLSRELTCCHFPLLDGPGNPHTLVAAALDTTVSLIRGAIPTLVVCSAGMSRAPSIVAGALALVDGSDPSDCLHRITDGQPHDIAPGLWDSVIGVIAARRTR